MHATTPEQWGRWNYIVDGCITIMPDGTDIQWAVSTSTAKCGEKFTVLESPDMRFAICGTPENLSRYANSILIAIAAKKISEVINHG